MNSWGGSNGPHPRTINHAQGLSAAAAVCGLLLCARLYRSDQCELCRTHHARRPRHVGRHVRLCVGMFYWGYFIFEVPSNVILEKVGARIWIARIMITWGILAGLTAVITGSTSFAIVRFLLGVAEAGFFPGIILYFTYWFPSHHHARIVSGFLVGLPVAVAIG